MTFLLPDRSIPALAAPHRDIPSVALNGQALVFPGLANRIPAEPSQMVPVAFGNSNVPKLLPVDNCDYAEYFRRLCNEMDNY
jgi:hypothetical protein